MAAPEGRQRPLPRWLESAREVVHDHVFGHPEGEVGGVLVGRREEGGGITVTAAIPALAAEGGRASLTFTHEAWAEIHGQMDSRYQDQEIVGWYHSHPGFGIFLSGHDLFIHQNFFPAEHQVAYVVDPLAGTHGTFGWEDGDVVKLEEGELGRRVTVATGRGVPPPAERDVAVGARGTRIRIAILVMALLGLLGLGLGIGLNSGTEPRTGYRQAPSPRSPARPVAPRVERRGGQGTNRGVTR